MTTTYPPNWPRCKCGRHVLDGHFTCGRVECSETSARETARLTWLHDDEVIQAVGWSVGTRFVSAGKEILRITPDGRTLRGDRELKELPAHELLEVIDELVALIRHDHGGQ